METNHIKQYLRDMLNQKGYQINEADIETLYLQVESVIVHLSECAKVVCDAIASCIDPLIDAVKTWNEVMGSVDNMDAININNTQRLRKQQLNDRFTKIQVKPQIRTVYLTYKKRRITI